MPAPDLHSEKVSGHLGPNWCYSGNQYTRFIFEPYQAPFDPNHQPTANELFTKQLATAWRSLTLAQQRLWKNTARRFHLPLYNAFLKTNYIRRRKRLPITTTPP